MKKLLTISFLFTFLLINTDVQASIISGKIENTSVTITSSPTPPPSTGGGGGRRSGGNGLDSRILLNNADTNNDGKVDIFDFINLMANWGKYGSNISADLNHDGKVDILDFVLLMSKWSK